MAAPLTEAAIQKMRAMIVSGALSPGSRLPPEAELATELGASRRGIAEEGAGANTVRQHQEIPIALQDHDPSRAEAAALVHVATTEAWFRVSAEALAPSLTGIESPEAASGADGVRVIRAG